MSDATPFRYRHSGVCIASGLELPEWAAFATGTTGEADIAILVEPRLAALADDGFGWTVDGDALRFTASDIGVWEVRGGHEIALAPIGEADPRELRLFTLGSAWGALGYQRGWAMLHGSAVEVGGRVALLCGDAGAGKSSLAAALVAEGAALLADDLSRVEDGRLWPSTTRLKLWEEALAALDWTGRERVPDGAREGKWHLPMTAPSPEPRTLDAIYLLEWGEGPRFKRLTGAQAAAALMRASCYRPDMLAEMGLLGEQSAKVAALAAHVPVVRFTRPRDLAALHESARAMAGDLASR